MLEIKNIRKSFGDLPVLKGVDLSVNQGDVVAIIGPSGSGKTTLLRCINFLETADDGVMVFDGETFPLKHISKRDIAAIRIGEQALDKVGLSDRCDYYPSQLSGGQQQRVAIARAIATDPEIIYFDEPTSALDPELTGEVLGVMRQLAKEGMTMLVVTHEMNFARTVSNQVIFMEHGKIVEAGASREFFEYPKEERAKAFLQTIYGVDGAAD